MTLNRFSRWANLTAFLFCAAIFVIFGGWSQLLFALTNGVFWMLLHEEK